MTLISGVMHGKDDAHPPVAYVPGEQRPEINRRERRVPIVRVQNHGIGAGDARNGRQCRHAEACITTCVVGIIRAGWPVEIGPIKVLGAFDEIDFGSDARIIGTLREAPQPRRLDPAADLHPERGADGLDLRSCVAHRGVQRHHDRRGNSRRRLEPRQAGDGLAEAAASGERRQFGDDVNDPDAPAIG